MADAAGTRDAVVIERTFDAPVELIWQMWADAEHFAAWYGPTGATIPVATMDVRVGGTRLVCMQMETPDGPMEMWFTGEYREVVPNQRLVYTESMSDEHGNVKSAADMGMPEGHPTTTEVIVELDEIDGRTRMVMTHVGIPEGSPGAMGWTMAFDKLAAHVDSQRGAERDSYDAAVFLMRFDMRAPTEGPASITELYDAAIEMAVWGEQHGVVSIVLSEHHASADGYLPSPLVLAAAIAARTSTVPIMVAALLLPLHDPVRLAEDMAVLDVISGGRVSYVAGLGYRPEEYAMFGRSLAERGRRMDECLTVLQRAWTGEEFEYDGRTVRVTPTPVTPGGPMLMYGGGSPAAARRAARFGLSFFAQTWADNLEQEYRDECERLGREPGACIVPAPGTATSAFVADDLDQAWPRLGPYLLHDARMYSSWLGDTAAASKSSALTVESLRAEEGAYRIFTPDQAVEYVRAHGFLGLHPLCGGCPPELAWESLELVAGRVMPALT